MMTYQDVVKANVEVHSKLAHLYNQEPHFRPENVEKVEKVLRELAVKTKCQRLLDMGCGTGFIIHIAKQFVPEIVGVDVTQALLDQVNCDGAQVSLHCEDIAEFQVEEESFDLVTAYAFIHHLFDVKPALHAAYRALKKGGALYIDLEPNFACWEAIEGLDPKGKYDAVVEREIRMVAQRSQVVQEEWGLDPDVFDLAEYGKNIQGGFCGESLAKLLKEMGFSSVDLTYHWFLGQAGVLHSQGEKVANSMEDVLRKSLPISKSLFKYLRLIAWKV